LWDREPALAPKSESRVQQDGTRQRDRIIKTRFQRDACRCRYDSIIAAVTSLG
jgi:hypothetical protein